MAAMTRRLFVACLLWPIVASALANEEPWIERPDLQEFAANRAAHPVLKGVVNLDLPPEQRWDSIISAHKSQVQDVMEYLKGFIPKWLQPLFFSAMRDVISYKGFPDDYRAEMQSIAKAMGVDVALVLMGNLLYELENIGVKCPEWNNTGPCTDHPNYVASTHEIFPFRNLRGADSKPGPRGLCTSVVAEDSSGVMWHGRDLDWDLPGKLRTLLIDVQYQRGGKTVFVGSGLVGYVGVLTAMRPGAYSWSLNARDHGGRTWENFLDALRSHGIPAAMKTRQVFETVADYAGAVKALSSGSTINGAYFTMAGAEAGQGVVITRGRDKADDTWPVNASEPEGWYRLQTNYDHWKPVPPMDDRRKPGYALMNALHASGLNHDSLARVMHTWPVFNTHTDFTAIMNPRTGLYETMWWDDGSVQLTV